MKNILLLVVTATALGFSLFKKIYVPQYVQPNKDAYHWKLHTPPTEAKLSDNLQLTNAIALDSTYYALNNIQNVFYTDKHIVVYDGNTDFIERLCFFDKSSGKLVKEVPFPKSDDGEIASIRSVSYVKEKKKFYALSGYYKSILVYSETGEPQGDIHIGMFGSRMEALKDGTFLVESSMNEDGIANFHRYVLFDSKGEVIQKYFPYSTYHKSFLFNMAGLLTKADETIYCAWPTTDTIYAFKNRMFTPVMVVDFEDNAMPLEKRLDQEWIKEGYFTDYSYLMTSFVKYNDNILFSYADEKAAFVLGLSNTQSNHFLNARTAIKDEYAALFKFVKIINNTNDEFTIYLNQSKAKSILSLKDGTVELIKEKSPEFYNTLQITVKSKNPVLLTFKMNINI